MKSLICWCSKAIDAAYREFGDGRIDRQTEPQAVDR